MDARVPSSKRYENPSPVVAVITCGVDRTCRGARGACTPAIWPPYCDDLGSGWSRQVAARSGSGERHATLGTTIEWSYQLLCDVSRDMFERLGVFPASFDLSAVHAVSAELDLVAATNAIGDLVAKNLVVHDPSGRYRLLETIRLVASDRLDRSGQRVEITQRLRGHVVARMASRTGPRAA